MSIDTDTLINAIEASFAMLPEVEGRVRHLTIPGIKGHETTLSHTMVNLVTSAELTDANAATVIQQVCDHFAGQHKAFSWVIGPSSTPADLGKKLTDAGLTKLYDIAGMALRDVDVGIHPIPAIRIREISPDDMEIASKTMARAFPAPENVVRFMYEVLFIVRAQYKTRIYLAYLDGVEEPVACSSMGFIPTQPIVHLRGAATLKEHRGKGIYTSLLARRLADARSDGAKAAVIQAIRATSAPVCRKLGFEEVCELEMYTRQP